MQNPHNLYVYRLARELKPLVYAFVETLPRNEEFNLKHQMRRSITSISNDIREGCTRHTNRAFLEFLYSACGSAGELVDQLEDALELRLGDLKSARSLHRRIVWLEMKTKDLIKAVERSETQRPSPRAQRDKPAARRAADTARRKPR